MDFSHLLSSIAGASGNSGSSYLNTNSSLIYTLNSNQNLISFDEFVLVIKSLHSFRVKEIKPEPCTNSVLVKLEYNCSMKHVRAKLGNIPATVCKVNPNIALDELSTLEALRNRFRFGVEAPEEEHHVQEPPKKRKYKSVHKPDVQIQSPEYK